MIYIDYNNKGILHNIGGYGMLEHLMEQLIPLVIHLLEAMGVIVILVAGIKAFAQYVANMIGKRNYPIKIELGQALSLALEFKMGAEILKTVIVRNLEEIWILAAIIIVRTILAVVIHWEINAEKDHNKEEHKKVEEAV